MVFFKDHKGSLVILSSESEDIEKGLSLHVGKPVFGRLADPPRFVVSAFLTKWSSDPTMVPDNSQRSHVLRSYLHNETSYEDKFITLGSRIISGDAYWGSSFRIPGEFTYTPKYWEWAEDILFRCHQPLSNARILDAVYASLYTYDRIKDIMRAFCENWCPATNTIHVASGEASISLWDLHKLGGLPIRGWNYDEVIPSAAELVGRESNGRRYLPESCEYLFAAFHHLSLKGKGNGKVLIADWINFWFRGEIKHSKPPARRERKTTRPKSTNNPNGLCSKRQAWESSVALAYKTLGGITNERREDIYLAAFLSCWLCVFVLPCEHSEYLRPETFRVASLMAEGNIVFNLAVPVLAKIYHGLNKLVNSGQAGLSNACFPAHYVYGWLSRYYGTHFPTPDEVSGPLMAHFSGEGGAKYFTGREARDLIFNKINWSANLFSRGDISIVDDDKIDPVGTGQLMSVRSSYLVVRCGDGHIVEPYSPHRFGRQFGFCQNVPGVLKKDIRTGDMDTLYKLCRQCSFHKSQCKLICTARTKELDVYTTDEYKKWWSETHDANYLETFVEKFMSSTNSKALPKRPRQQKETLERKSSNAKLARKDESIQTSNEKVSSSPQAHFEEGQNSTEILEDMDVVNPANSCDESESEVHFKRTKRKQVCSPTGCPTLSDIPSCSTLPECYDRLFQDQDLNKEVTNVVHPVGSEVSISRSHKSDDAGNNDMPQVPPPSKIASQLYIEPSSSTHAEAPIFDVDKVLHDSQVKFAKDLWENFQGQLLQIPFSQLDSFYDQVQKILDVIGKIEIIDSSFLRNMVKGYFDQAQKLASLKSSCSLKMPEESHIEKLHTLETHLATSKSYENKWQSELKNLELRKKELESFLKSERSNISKTQEEIASVKSIPILTKADCESLELLQRSLESSHNDLKNFKWEP